LVFYSLLSSLILSNLKHELLNRLRSTMAANVLKGSFVDIMQAHLLTTVDNVKISEVPYPAYETGDGTLHSLNQNRNVLHLLVPFILQVTTDVSNYNTYLLHGAESFLRS
jgi:hypothetical protein